MTRRLHPADQALLADVAAAGEAVRGFSTEALEISRANEKQQAAVISIERAALADARGEIERLRAELLLGANLERLEARLDAVETTVREKLTPKPVRAQRPTKTPTKATRARANGGKR